MKVKVFDEEHEKDLETEVNKFLNENDVDVIDIKLSSSCAIYGEEQLYCFTALIIYKDILEK
ncbi:MAG: sporulation protein Cse60 [Bacilli bacterium]